MATALPLDELTECPICAEVYTDPRALPCVHTYCLKCLVELSKEKQPGDKLACPLCRKEFTLSSNGVRDLEKNIFVDKVVQVRREMFSRTSASEMFLQQMASDADEVADGVQQCREMLDSLQKEEEKLIEQIAKAKLEIDEKTDQLIHLIGHHKDQLTTELSLFEKRRLTEVEDLREEIKKRLWSMDNYIQTVNDVMSRSTDNDIARAARGLRDRAEKLLKFDVMENQLAELGHADVKFTSSGFAIDDINKTLEQLCLSVAKESKRPSNGL